MSNYDEKQVKDRGKAFQYGFITAMIVILAEFITADIIGLAINAYALFLFCYWTPLTVCFITLIVKDAYDGVNSTSGCIVAFILGLLGLFIVVATIIRILIGIEAFVIDGSITEAPAHIYSGLVMLTISLTYWVKQFLNKKKYTEA